EGTPAQMLASLDALAALPADTRVCCAHEYTLGNLRFACAVEPGNRVLADYQRHCQQLREAGQPTLPSSIGTERAINPFLRSREPAVTQAVQARTPSATGDVAVFAALREWKNEFR
ncbi:MAG: hydroxyacylglutathione hydrolase, partial [Ottowia sp.]|nr:hydroxyacylglutathione hydrolase [Ottowia sp.]